MNILRVRARIRFLSAEEGGRTSPVRGDYRPNHNFGDAEDRDMDIGRIVFPEGEALQPGESMERNIEFFDRPGLSEILTPGRQWRIQEGPSLVGVGTVLEVL